MINIKKILVANLLAISCLAVSATAFANCNDVGSVEWAELTNKMNTAFDADDLDGALAHAKELTLICNHSPVINYTMSEIYRKMGRETDSYQYVKAASEDLQEYSVPQSIAEKIWFRRAEFDQPYKKKLEEANEVIAKQEEQINTQNKTFNDKISTSNDIIYDVYEDRMYTIQWAGTGIAIGGAALAIAGGVLLGLNHGKADDSLQDYICVTEDSNCSADKRGAINKKKSIKNFEDKNKLVQVSWGLLLGGAGLAIVGTVFATYAHFKIKEIEDVRSGAITAFSIDVSPTSVGLTLDF